MRPSDDDLEELRCGFCSDDAWAELWRARAAEAELEVCLRGAGEALHDANARADQAVQVERAALEAKLREAKREHEKNMERYASQCDERIRAEMERAEKAERERNEARRRLLTASAVLHARNHTGPWSSCATENCSKDRAALGVEP